MERVDEIVVKLRAKLLQFLQNDPRKSLHIGGSISWCWVCVQLFNLISIYPFGVTEAIIFSELHSQYLKTKGWLKRSSSYQGRKSNGVSEVLDLKAVSYEYVMEVRISSAYYLPGTSTKIAHLVDVKDNTRYLEMYLHRKFYDSIDNIKTHVLRMTGLRLVPHSGFSGYSSHRSASLRLLPTEYVVVVLESTKDEKLLNRFEPLCSLIETCCITQANYIQDLSAKVISISSEETVHSPDGTAYKRLIVELEMSQESQISVPLVLWDSYVQFAKLFDKGDTLLIERPYAKPYGVTAGGHGTGGHGSGGRGVQFCLEYGPATTLYLLPYTPQLEVLSSQHLYSLKSHVSVRKTDDGQLDFQWYSERLVIANVVPSIVNAVMLVKCEQLDLKEEELARRKGEGSPGKEEEEENSDRFSILLHVSDHTGTIEILLTGFEKDLYCHIYPSQLLLLTGLSSFEEKGRQLCMKCDSASGGTVTNVSSLHGWTLSPSVCTHVTLENLSVGDHHFTTIARLKEWVVQDGCGWRVWPLRGSSDLQGGQDEGNSTVKIFGYFLRAIFSDNTGSLKADFTSTAAERLLQKSPLQFWHLSEMERKNILSSFIDIEMTLCISKVKSGDYQVNSAMT